MIPRCDADQGAEKPADLTALSACLQPLADFAEAGGAERIWLEQKIKALFTALLELEEHRSGYNDPRRLKALQLGERIAKAKDAGASISELSSLFSRSPSRIYRLLDIFARHRATVSVFTPCQPTKVHRGEIA